MRVLVCGGRNYRDRDAVWSALGAIHRSVPMDTLEILQGGATGADQLARAWCLHWYVPYINVPADWPKLGKAAGPIRNQKMLDKYPPNLVLAFPGGSGTADMVRRAKAAKIEVREIMEDAA